VSIEKLVFSSGVLLILNLFLAMLRFLFTLFTGKVEGLSYLFISLAACLFFNVIIYKNHQKKGKKNTDKPVS